MFSYALSENDLIQHFFLESQKIVKPIFLALFSCLVSVIIFLDFFSSVCIPFPIYLAQSSSKLIYLWLLIGKCFYCKTNFNELLILFSACSIYFMIYFCFLAHFLILASHSCILVTEPSENEPVEPTESVEPEPGVPFVVEFEANQGKQLSINPCSYLT